VTSRSGSIVDRGYSSVLKYRIPGGIKVETSEAFQNGFRNERVRMRGNLGVHTNDVD
jgi:hypothetical protein